MTLRSTAHELFTLSVLGKVAPPVASFPYEVRHDGTAMVVPSVGGITYDFTVGDRVFGRYGCHVEPGVSCKADEPDSNRSLNLLSCVGNEATVRAGKADGARGTVIGKHSVINHVLIHFPAEVLERLKVGDEIQIRAVGQGLCLCDHPGVRLMNMSPSLLERLDLRAVGGVVEFPVVARIPAFLAGSGIGTSVAQMGDVDIMTADRRALTEHGLDGLRIGDFVAIDDLSSHWGWVYEKGATSVGVVVHADSVVAGHGPGVTALVSARSGCLEPVITPDANLGAYLNLACQQT